MNSLSNIVPASNLTDGREGKLQGLQVRARACSRRRTMYASRPWCFQTVIASFMGMMACGRLWHSACWVASSRAAMLVAGSHQLCAWLLPEPAEWQDSKRQFFHQIMQS